jgi:TetR/AcrR family transcriptional regulator, regulator of autoinduction and epiphytic fitness
MGGSCAVGRGAAHTVRCSVLPLSYRGARQWLRTGEAGAQRGVRVAAADALVDVPGDTNEGARWSAKHVTDQFTLRLPRIECGMARGSFREQVLRVREDAIISSVNRLLAEKGFDAMTVDEVAADVGIAKASLYKHFASKEALAAAAMVRVLERGAQLLADQAAQADRRPSERLRAVARWALEQQLLGEMPTLPSQNSSLRTELLSSKSYVDLLMRSSDLLGEWIVQAQERAASSLIRRSSS